MLSESSKMNGNLDVKQHVLILIKNIERKIENINLLGGNQEIKNILVIIKRKNLLGKNLLKNLKNRYVNVLFVMKKAI